MWELLITRYRFYTYSVIFFIAFLIIAIVVLIFNAGRVKDVELLSDVKTVSYALEGYFSNHQRYPEADNLDLSQRLTISDAGFGQPEGHIYYQGTVEGGTALYTGADSGYQISFKLRRAWSDDVLSSGKYCIISTNFVIQCTDEK